MRLKLCSGVIIIIEDFGFWGCVMKKILSFILVTALLITVLTVIPFYSFAKEKDISPVSVGGSTGDCTWDLDYNGKLTISGSGSMEDYETVSDIPWNRYSEIINSVDIQQGVRYIGKYAISGCGNLTNVKLPDTLSEIGKSAFSGCHSLWGITIPGSVRCIGEGAFSGCINLSSIIIPDSVIIMGDYAFSSCYKLSDIKLSGGVTKIGNNTFQACPITHIEIPDTVTAIGDNAFYSCRSLRSVVIPKSVTSIGEKAFCYCVKLQWVSIPNSVTSIGESAFKDATGGINIHLSGAFSSDFYKAFCDYDGSLSVRLDDSVTKIDDRFFAWSHLRNIYIPDGVTSIGSYALEGNLGLSNLTLPDSITSIGDGAFRCLDISEIRVPEGITELKDFTFADCESLKRVFIPASVKKIGYGVFSSGIGGEIEHMTETRTDFIIFGMAGSYAQEYADENGITFFPLDEYPKTLNPSEDPSSTEETESIVITLDSCCIEGDTVICKVFLQPELSDKQIDFYYHGFDSDESFYLGSGNTDAKGTSTVSFKADSKIRDIYAVYTEDPGVISDIVEPVITEPTSGTETYKKTKIGDVDGDGEVTVADATRIQQWLVNLIDDSKIDLEAAKTAGQPVTIADATRIQMHLAHMLDLEA